MTNDPLAECPDAVRAYMRLTSGGDRAAAIVAFADAAHVTDDGHDYHGAAAVRTWLDRAASEYTFTTTPLAVATDSPGRTIVTCHLDGNFPGSPVDLDYRFQIDPAQRIERLEIRVHTA